MSEIPEDVMKAARSALDGFAMDAVNAAARAIQAERERSKRHWLEKRSEISRKAWLRAAKAALAGDIRELRNRVEICEAEPMELVLSAAAIRKGD